jgi:hypothetical protein
MRALKTGCNECHYNLSFKKASSAIKFMRGQMAKKPVFVCFDFDNDKTLKDFIIGQSKHTDSPFEVIDCSLKGSRA